MRLTPYHRTFTIAAGGPPVEIEVYGRYICMIAVVPATMTLSIDDEAPNLIISGTQIDVADNPYRKLTFRNPGGAPSTAIVLISNVKVEDMRGDNLMAAIAAAVAASAVDLAALEILITAGNVDLAALEVLVTAGNVDLAALEVLVTAGNVDLAALEVLNTSILAELHGVPGPAAMVADVTPVGMAAAVVFLAANPARVGCLIQAMSDNTASIFVGSTNATTDVNKLLELQPGQGKEWDNYPDALYVYSVGGGDSVHGGEW
jgi:hypothetical protein